MTAEPHLRDLVDAGAVPLRRAVYDGGRTIFVARPECCATFEGATSKGEVRWPINSSMLQFILEVNGERVEYRLQLEELIFAAMQDYVRRTKPNATAMREPREALYDAVKYVLDRAQRDPDFADVCDPATETFARLCAAEAAHLCSPVETVRERRMEIRFAPHREQRSRRQIAEDRVELLRSQLDAHHDEDDISPHECGTCKGVEAEYAEESEG